jgi:tetratricopeptide (TPR) repeat protein
MRRLELTFMLAACAVLVADCGSRPKGKSLAQQYQDALKLPDAVERSRRLTGIAEKQQQAADLLSASQSLAAAKEAAHAVADPGSRAAALIRLSGYYVRLEQSASQAQTVLNDARQAIGQVRDVDAKVPLLADLAAARGQHLKDADGAANDLKSAEEAAATIELPLTKTRSLTRIAVAYGKLELANEAERVLAAALDYARSQPDPRQKCDCLAEVAAARAAMKQSDQAMKLLDEARESAGAIAADDSRAYALINLAQKAKSGGRKQTARDLLSQAEDIARNLNDNSIRSPLLDDIQAARTDL